MEAVLDEEPDAGRAQRRIRVLHLITSLERGGAENHLLALMTHANRAEIEFETAVLCGEGELVPTFRAAGIPVHLLKARARFDPLALGRLVALLRERRYDVVHAHLFRADIYGGLAVRRVGPRRPCLVSTRHNDDRFFLNPFIGIVHYLLSARQDMIIAISDHVAHFTIARGVRHPARVRRVYHGLRPPDTAVQQR